MNQKVICFGTFDLLHLGHLNYLKQAKQEGDHLTVIIARDKTKKQQQKEIVFTEGERAELIKNLKIVDEVILGDEEDFLKVIKNNNPEIICLGYDHQVKIEKLKEDLNKMSLFPKIKRMDPYQTNKHKSSIIRKKILQDLND